MMCRSIMSSRFMRQCFVTFGVTLNTMEQSVMNGFSSVLVPQLRATKYIELDEEDESWIGSVHHISMIIGALIVPLIMGRFGRKAANFLSAAFLCICWFSISVSTDFFSLVFIKLVQGLCSGMIAIFGSVAVGEYTSPKYRGAFLTTIALSYSFGILFVHGLGAILSWQNVARIFTVVTFLDCVIILYSPESPSFLASRGRYEECRKAFHWLRYPEEEAEVEKLIKFSMSKIELRHMNAPKGFKLVVKRKIHGFIEMLKKREFYMPIFLMFHLHLINEWSGAAVIDAFTTDIYKHIVGDNIDMNLLIISTDVQRILTNSIAVFGIKKLRRRLMLIGTISLNIIVYLCIAVYVFVKTYFGLSFDNSAIGVMLIHIHIFSIAAGSLPLPNIIAGEIFALEYRGLSSTIALMFFTINVVINSKTALFLLSTIGLHGTYLIYAGFVTYGLIVSWIMLPETKDKTLQDIEEKFKGKPLVITSTLEAACDKLPDAAEENNHPR